jgi:hypothetical protein
MKTTDTAINRIYSLLTGAGGLTCPVYKLNKPTANKDTEYVVINSLPVNSAVMQYCHVNVNYHVADLKPGMADTETLEDGTASVQALLHQKDTTGILIDFESQEYIREQSLKEHYSNIRYFVKLLN